MKVIPKRYEHIVFGALLSGMMSFIVSGVSTLLALGPVSGFFVKWIAAWVPSWSIAFPTVLIVAPVVRRILHRIVKEG